MQRYFIDQNNAGDQVKLPDDIAHHLVTVLRATVGTEFELVMADHQTYLAELTSVVSTAVTAKIVKKLGNNSELPVKAILACGLPKTKEKPELIVQKGTELGATEIIFFEAERSISHWNSQKQSRKIARLQKIADAAAEQSHRNVKPQIEYCPSLKQLLANYPATIRLVAWEESAKEGESSQLAQSLAKLQRDDSVLAIFGPEGGLTPTEVNIMEENDVIPVGLGPRILRTETAPLYFLATVSFITELAQNS